METGHYSIRRFIQYMVTDFAPKAFRETRVSTAKNVEEALKETNYLNSISPAILQRHPEVLPILRMSTCPPIARDRLIGLAGVSKNLVQKYGGF